MPRFVFAFLIALVVLGILYLVTVKLVVMWSRSGKLQREVRERLAVVCALSISQAKERAFLVLADSKKFRVTENPIYTTAPTELGKTLQEFFGRFETVTAFAVKHPLIGPSISPAGLRSGFIRLGTDSEFAEIVARPGEDAVFLIDGSEPTDPQAQEAYPSIYHFLIAYYGDDPPRPCIKSQSAGNTIELRSD